MAKEKKERSEFKIEVEKECDALGKNMQKWRGKREITQKKMADKIETVPSCLSNYEHNKTAIPASAVIEYSKILNVPINELFGENEVVEISDKNILAEYHKLSNRLQYYVYEMLRTMNKI